MIYLTESRKQKSDDRTNIAHATQEDVAYFNALEEKIKKDSSNVKLLIEKGFLCMTPFHWTEEGLATFREVIALDNTNVEAHFWLAKFLSCEYEYEEAKKILEIALMLDSNKAECHSLLAFVLKKLEEDPEKSIAHLQKTIKLEPTWIFPRTTLSHYFLKKGDFAKAKEITIAAYNLYQSTVPPKITAPMEKYYEKHVTGRTHDFTYIFSDLFKKIREEKEQYMDRTNIAHATQEDVAYLNALEEKIEKDPGNVKLLIEKGFLCMEPFHWRDEGLATFREAVALDSTNADAYFWLAKSLHLDHFKDEEAKKALEIALMLNPNKAECHSFLAGVLKTLKEDSEKSIAHLQKTIELEPTWIHPRTSLSYYFLRKGDIAKAEETAIEAYKVYKSTVPPKITTPMEEHHEGCITGRTRDLTDRFDVLFKKIQEAKK